MPSIEVSEQHGIRYLHFGSDLVQGAMRVARPWALELRYTRELMVPLLMRSTAGEAHRSAPDWPASVLLIGLGAASVTKFLHRYRPDAKITVVEIAPEVVAAARQSFKLPEESARLRILIGDGAEYVAQKRRKFDLIVVDGYDAVGRPGMLDTLPFLLNARDRLASGGLVSFNLIDRGRGTKASIERLHQAFDGQVLVLPRIDSGNTIALAGADFSRLAPRSLIAPARALKAATGLDLLPTIARMM